MKKYYFSFMAILLPAVIYAQPNLTNLENYSPGMQMKFKEADATGKTAGSAGANQTWTFTSLQVLDSFTQKTTATSNTQYAGQFPGSNICLIKSDGSYEFYNETSTQNNMLGMADSANALLMAYTDPVLRAKRPFTFGNAATDIYTLNAPNRFGTGNTTITADGYGTLQLPNGSYSNVLRVKITIHEMDTILFGPAAFNSDLQSVQFKWYDANHKSPLLVWDSTHLHTTASDTTTKSIYYLQSETPTGILHPDIQRISFTAGIHNGNLLLKGEFDHDKQYDFVLQAMNGQTVYSNSFKTNSNNWVALLNRDLAAGIYSVTITQQDNMQNQGSIKLYKD